MQCKRIAFDPLVHGILRECGVMAFFGNAAIHGRSAPNILFAQSVLSSHSHTLTFAFVDGDKKRSNKNKQVVSFMLPYRCLLSPPVTTSCYLATNACGTVAEQRRALDKGARRRDRVLVRDRFRLCHCTCFRSFSCSHHHPLHHYFWFLSIARPCGLALVPAHGVACTVSVSACLRRR